MTQPADPSPARPARWRDGVLAALALTLSRPGSWAVALAGFLARGGLLWFVVPIVPLPTTASLANEVSPRLRAVVLGALTPEFVVLTVVVVVATLAWLIVGGLIGGWSDAQVIRAAAGDEELGYELPSEPVPWSTVARVGVVRVAAHAPLLVSLIAVSPLVFAALYAELTNPGEVVTPLLVRTLARMPQVVLLVVVAWLIGEVAGGLGARRVLLRREAWVRATMGGYADIVAGLPGVAATFVVTTLGVAAAVIPAALAAGLGWSFTRLTLLGDRTIPEVLFTVVLFVAIWSGGLVIAGAAVAFRSHAWTAEWLRRHVPRASPIKADVVDVGTIGPSDQHRRGDWSSSGPSGTV
jgi:hypothetical protein